MMNMCDTSITERMNSYGSLPKRQQQQRRLLLRQRPSLPRRSRCSYVMNHRKLNLVIPILLVLLSLLSSYASATTTTNMASIMMVDPNDTEKVSTTASTGIYTSTHNINMVPSSSSSSTATATTATTAILVVPPVLDGQIDDLSNTCHIQDIEHVNTVQLYEILHNLQHLSTIRNIQIDLIPSCIFSPLQSTTTKSSGNSHPKKTEPKSNKKEAKKKKATKPKFLTSTLGTSKSTGAIEEEEEDGNDSFQCSGGSVSEELDDDAEPLCTVQGATATTTTTTSSSTTTATTSNPFVTRKPTASTQSSSSSSPSFQSNVLHQLQQSGFTSQSQEDTFTWRDMTDTVFTEVEVGTMEENDSSNDRNDTNLAATTNNNTSISGEDKLQPDHFWDDMCSALWNGKDRSVTSSTTSMINLALNPERNTGYNGTHIWRAIYDENCIVRSTASQNNNSDTNVIDVVDDMCYEERVLYRLLSGLHSSTTISIAKHYYPPSKKKNRTNWEANPTYFMEHVYHNPEYIRNLHFTYVVLLRAVSKASTFLYHYDFRNENSPPLEETDEEDIVMTQKLVRRLLDSSILQSCHSVFSAFDESLMFQEEKYTSYTSFSSNSGNNNATSSLSSIYPTFLNNNNHTSSKESKNDNQKVDVALLRQNFKGIFQNVSSILDCVQCQQCKLHGKLVMLGYGAALKVLLNPNSKIPELEHNEIIALINTVIKFSEAIKDVRELTNLYIVQQRKEQQQQLLELRNKNNSTVVVVPTTLTDPTKPIITTKPIGAASILNETTSTSNVIVTDLQLVDLAIQVIATLGRNQRISLDREEELIQLVFQRDANLLLLVKHYHSDLEKFLKFSASISRFVVSSSTEATASYTSSTTKSTTIAAMVPPTPDAIVVGSGLAGMATTLNILDRGGRVVIIDKEHVLGGNSGKASSGINACCLPNGTNDKDSTDLFWNDTFRSAGSSAQNELITTLVANSANAVNWLRTRLGVDLSLVAQLGGHSTYRTHRPKNGMVGAEIIYAIQKAIKAYVKDGKVTILTDTKVTNLLTDDHGAVIGVEYVPADNANGLPPKQLYAPNVVLATGGFASDRSEGSYLSKYRPELMKMPATAGPFSTGDGIQLATQLGAATVDMDKVQVHPTGWVDPADPDNRSKILAGELMRGVGGILLNSTGHRFCNELGTRAYVTNQMLSHDPIFARTGNWSLNATVPTFSLILSSAAATDGKKHVDLYTHKGLLTRLEGVSALAQWMKVPRNIVVRTLKEYQRDAADGIDVYGKQTFKGVPRNDLDHEVFYAGTVTPVLHYCMGGVAIDAKGNVLNENGEIIPGLHAAGEVSGGVHGVNRLGGNSLLECTVYGTIVGQKLPIQSNIPSTPSVASDSTRPKVTSEDNTNTNSKQRIITTSELQRHNTPDDCWVAIHGIVYDLTDFAEEHPAGAISIHELAGMDGTEAFAAVHNTQMLEDFDEEIRGVYTITTA